MAEIGIGSTVFVFDHNHRVYGKDRGSPIYREYWVPVGIRGENRSSWLLDNYYERFSKKPPHQTKTTPYGNHRVAISVQEVDDDCWQHDHRYRIVRLVERCDVAVLRQIAALVGYSPEEEK